MKFSYSAVWNDTVALLRAHGALIAALAGVFIFLPALLIAQFVPQNETPAATVVEAVAAGREYLLANWHWLLLQTLLNIVGTIAILTLVFARSGTSVGQAIAHGFTLLPFFFLASILANIAIGIGLVLLIVPGLYLIGRLAPLGPVIVAEQEKNPIAAIRRTFEVTKGNGWRVLGLVFLVALAAAILALVVNMLLGILFTLIAGQELGALLARIVEAATGAALATLLVLLYAAIYRALSPRAAPEVFA